MKRTRLLNAVCALIPLAALGSSFGSASADPTDYGFVHYARAENIRGNCTYLPTYEVYRPWDRPLVTQRWDWASGGVYNDHPVGVWFDPYEQRWAIFNEDWAPMPVGAMFNVKTITTGYGAPREAQATEGPLQIQSSDAYWYTVITQAYNPGGGWNGVYNAASVGVFNELYGQEIGNLNGAPLPQRAGFFFEVLSGNDVVHRAAQPFLNFTVIDSPATNGSPSAILIVSSVMEGGATRNAREVGVFYLGGLGKWAIFNQDHSPMPQGAVFTVLVAGQIPG